ncbi:MAG: helix-turn-helix domain-containing protein [Acetatifactor sp.]|nr:helix-turn-helix domain-containing protein [Acetatifactor sp.]
MFTKHSKTFYKYLFSYLSVMVLCLSISVLFVVLYLFPLLKSNITESHNTALMQTAGALDGKLELLYQTSYQLSYSNENLISYYIMEESPIRDVKIISELESYSAISSFIEEIGLLSSKSDFIYTSTGVYPTDLFFKNEYQYPTVKNPKNLFLSYTTNVTVPASHTSSASHQYHAYLTFINPPYALSNLPDITMLFWVKERELAEILDALSSESTFSAILSNGESIYSSLELESAEQTRELYAAVSGNASNFRINNKDYVLFIQKSGVNDWIYVYGIDVDEVFSGMNVIRMLLLIVVAVAVAICIFTIWYYMRLNYLPLKKIKILTDKLELQYTQNDEIDSLNHVLDYLSSQSRYQIDILKNSKLLDSLKNSLLFSLIKGHVSSVQEFNRDGASLNLKLTMPNYQVLMIQLRGIIQENSSVADMLSRLLSSAFSDKYEVYFRELFEENQYVIILALDDDVCGESEIRCRNLRDMALEEDVSMTIGIGRIYRQISGFQSSCLEADQALHNSFVLGHGSVITYREEDFTDIPLLQLYPSENMNSLRMSIRCGDYENFRQQAETIFTHITEQKMTADYARNICNSITSILTNELPSEDLHHSTNTLLLMYHADTLNGYKLYFNQITQDLISSSAPKEEQNTDLLTQIQQYIMQNYDDCNFSAQKIADAMNINSSYLSQFFKSHTDENLNNYIANLRIIKAKRLLVSTNLSLPAIAEEVGYYNQNSFIRRFKQITGMTPGTYRKKKSTE